MQDKRDKIVSKIYDEETNSGINKKIKTAFTRNRNLPSVTLNNFFTDGFIKTIEHKFSSLQFKHEKIADKHSYSKAKFPTTILPKQFSNFISAITNKKLKLASLQALKLSKQDYTLLHDNNISGKHLSKYLLIIDMTAEWETSWGGELCLTNDKGEHLFVLPGYNSLTIIRQNVGIRYFIKYVNNLAKKERKMLVLRFN